MASIEDISRKLDQVVLKQKEYECKFYSDEPDTASNLCVAGKDIQTLEQEKNLQELSEMILQLKAAVDDLIKKQKKQDQHLDDLEQYGRSNCIILHGNPKSVAKMSNFDMECYVIETLNKRLDLPYELTEFDIDICHPLPSKKDKQPIIIKFVRRTIRNLIFSRKKMFKQTRGPNLSITESLTKRRLRLVEEARKVFQFNHVWTTKGIVHCSFKGKIHKIFDSSDIAKIRFADDSHSDSVSSH